MNSKMMEDLSSKDLIHAQSDVVLLGFPINQQGPRNISFLFQILDLSAKFVMVNAGDDDEPSEEVYKPDGGYIPR